MSESLEFRGVSVALADGRLLLDDVSLALGKGTVAAILGRSGSGKTTLLRTANRLIRPTRGQIMIADKNVDEIDPIQLRRRIGYVIQEAGLFPHCDALRNVGMVLEAKERPREQRNSHSKELLQLVGLDPATFSQRYPHQLSGGQRQRVGLARALAADPEILLMDEPFGALDPLTRAEMQDMLLNLLKRLSTTVLLVTHDLDEALYIADQIVLLDKGKVVADLSRSEFLRSTQAEIVAYAQAFHRSQTNQLAPPDAKGEYA